MVTVLLLGLAGCRRAPDALVHVQLHLDVNISGQLGGSDCTAQAAGQRTAASGRRTVEQ